jgi:hypothetical protein
MKLYDPKKHEWFLVYWYTELNKDETELNNLFCKPLQSLTQILIWAKNSVNIMFENDDEGIRFAAWCAPEMSGAEFGAWCRKSWRGTKAHLKFMDEAYERALSMYPVLIGRTKQEKLHRLHLRMGYEFVGVVPGLFDGSPVREYYMTRQTRDERRNRRHDAERHVANPVDAREIRADRHSGLASDSGQVVVPKGKKRKSIRLSKASNEKRSGGTHAPDDSPNGSVS